MCVCVCVCVCVSLIRDNFTNMEAFLSLFAFGVSDTVLSAWLCIFYHTTHTERH